MRRINSLLFLIGILILIFLFRSDFVAVYDRYFTNFEALADLTLEQVRTKLSTPPPLRGGTDRIAGTVVLTRSGVIVETNLHRVESGLEVLLENPKLNKAAEAKVKDMFARQYFAHVSPTDESAHDLAKNAQYEAIVIGENLALGNYQDDRALVQAWMDSPGHRENIMNSKFDEIGVGVGKGSYEGRETWLAVQIFGRPISACPQPDGNLKSQIEKNKGELDDLEIAVEKKQDELENTKPKRGSEYNQKVEEYDLLVSQYNALLESTKGLIDHYNSQVRAANECAES